VLDRPAAAREQEPEPGPVHALDHRIQSTAGRPKGRRIGDARSSPIEHPEPPRVLVRKRRPIHEPDHGMRVGNQRIRLTSMKPKVPRHPQVRDETRPAIEIDEQELAMAPHAENGPARSAARQGRGHGLAQRQAREPDIAHGPPRHVARERAADGLDFGEFRHESTVCGSPGTVKPGKFGVAPKQAPGVYSSDMRIAALLILATLACPATGQAQPYRTSVLWIAPDSAAAPEAPDSARVLHAPDVPNFDPTEGEPSLLSPILCGAIGAVGLGIAGGLIGNSTDNNYDDIPVGAFTGYFIGETIGVPIGAHVGNVERGNLAGDLGISILGHIVALGLSTIGGGAGYIAGVSAQIIATAVTEQKTGRRRAIDKHERELADEAAKGP
jgi:hypothetical protein